MVPVCAEICVFLCLASRLTGLNNYQTAFLGHTILPAAKVAGRRAGFKPLLVRRSASPSTRWTFAKTGSLRQCRGAAAQCASPRMLLASDGGYGLVTPFPAAVHFLHHGEGHHHE